MKDEDEFVKITLAKYTALMDIANDTRMVFDMAISKQKQRAETWQGMVISLLYTSLSRYDKIKGDAK